MTAVSMKLRENKQREKIEKILLYLDEIRDYDVLCHIRTPILRGLNMHPVAFDRYVAYLVGKGWARVEVRHSLGNYKLYYLTDTGILACDEIRKEILELEVI